MPLQIPFNPPPELRGMSGQELRSAFMATTLSQVPVANRNDLPLPDATSPVDSQYRELWNASLKILTDFNATMAANTGIVPALPRMPQSIKPIDKLRAGIETQDYNRQVSGRGAGFGPGNQRLQPGDLPGRPRPAA